MIRMKTVNSFIAAMTMAVLAACSSNPNKAEEIETKMERSDRVGAEQVGVKDGEMVIQRKAMLAEELRRLQVGVYELEDKVYGNQELGSWGLYGVLKDCRKKLSSKEYGGNGKLKWIEAIDRVTDKEDDFKIGIDENNELVAVREEYLKDRIERFKKYKTILSGRQIELQNKIDVCEAELQSQMHSLKEQESD